MKKIKLLFFAGIFLSFHAYPQEDFSLYEPFLSTDAIGAAQFLKKNPQADGRGTVIAVLDTGVDMGVAGLKTTTTGEVKVIEARDFSGQGDVKLNYSELSDGTLRSENRWVKGVDKLLIKPVDGKYYIGFLEETKFKNSYVKDINGNGKFEDIFAVVVFKAKNEQGEDYIAFIDRDGDGDISDEQPVYDYSKKLQPFTFEGFDPQRMQAPMHCALNIEDGGTKVSIHTPDGSHGTHVAGIAAGYKINGKTGFNGIAPGAKILSLKIGDNTLSGGATTSESKKKALEYAARYAREKGLFVVVNMSYGVGSEIEGKSDIDKLVDRLAVENPHLFMAFSAGNQGPGLSTVGTPAAALHIFAAGALLTEKNSNAMFGGSIKGDKVFNFSSRGGELNKPDGLAPGIASSSVPSYEKKDLFRGTSMASPQVAGAMAVILSAFQQEKTSNKELNSGILKRALKYSAKPLKDYGWIDQGGGVISVPEAFDTMKAYLKRGDAILMDYIVETDTPTLAGYKGSAAFWRAGGFFPSGSDFQEFKIRPVFRKDAGSEQVADFYRTFTLQSSVPWLKADRTKAYIKGGGDLTIRVFYDEKFFKGKTGVFTGKITAYNGAMSKGKDSVEFELPATVIIPEKFGGEKGYEKAFRNERLDAGDIKRYFFSVPPGASTLIIDGEAPEKKYSMVFFYLFDQYGKFTPLKKSFINTNEGEKMSGVVSGNDLVPGTYELVAYAPVSAPQTSFYDLYVRFSGLSANLKGVRHEAGKLPEGNLSLFNAYNEPFLGEANGTVTGYQKSFKRSQSSDTIKENINMNPELEGIEFVIEMSDGDFAKFTDVAVNILDQSGKAIYQGGMNNKKLQFFFKNPGVKPGETANFNLEIRSAFAEFSKNNNYTVHITERFLFSKKTFVDLTLNGNKKFTIYPQIPAELRINFNSTLPAIPADTQYYMEIYFYDYRSRKQWLVAPFEFRM